HEAGTDLITITQYLRPSVRHHPVDRWVKPEEFVALSDEAERIGFLGVMAGPLVRSSYRAGRLWGQAMARRGQEIPEALAHLARPGTARQEAASLLARGGDPDAIGRQPVPAVRCGGAPAGAPGAAGAGCCRTAGARGRRRAATAGGTTSARGRSRAGPGPGARRRRLAQLVAGADHPGGRPPAAPPRPGNHFLGQGGPRAGGPAEAARPPTEVRGPVRPPRSAGGRPRSGPHPARLGGPAAAGRAAQP